MSNSSPKYKLRAECFNDIYQFLILVRNDFKVLIFEIKIEQAHPDHSDFTMEFRSELNIKEIRRIIYAGTDLHVMAQTLKPIHEYDGDRDFDL